MELSVVFSAKEKGLADATVWQAGAFCLRRDVNDDLEILLIESRRNGLWGVPKGHIESNETTAATAKREAFEEAGVLGDINAIPFGMFRYKKDSCATIFHVTVHELTVASIAEIFPEKTLRPSKWFPIKSAVRTASHPGLKRLLQKLAGSECGRHQQLQD
ncbi:hypothetical protein BTE56_23070 [Agrobacterium pusense]|nr:hypothetical protein BTE56_23070 [Agrobacterium pusense]